MTKVEKQQMSHEDVVSIWTLIFPYSHIGELYGYVSTDLSPIGTAQESSVSRRVWMLQLSKSEVFEKSLLQNTKLLPLSCYLSIFHHKWKNLKAGFRLGGMPQFVTCFYHFHLAIFSLKLLHFSCETYSFLVTEFKAFYWKGPHSFTEVVQTDFSL